MQIKQFWDKGLSHISYAIESEGKIALIDPGRDTTPYRHYANKLNSEIVAVIETHPHADFISSHAEFAIHHNVKVYTSRLSEANYDHITFDDGDEIKLGKVKLKAMNTPGHSPDSISVAAEDEGGKISAIFTGDTLFIGDVGRPDLRESADKKSNRKEIMARQLYHSLRDKILKLPDDTMIYPTHGPGSLCGKSMSTNLSDSIGNQKRENYALQPMTENNFVEIILENQPFVPRYFAYDVLINKLGAPKLNESLKKIRHIDSTDQIEANSIVIDSRNAEDFKKGHLPNAINIPNGGKFETWLGSILSPEETFYLIASDAETMDDIIRKTSKIGYESKISGTMLFPKAEGISTKKIDSHDLLENESSYTIIDVREEYEVMEKKYFKDSINIPLHLLRENINKISDKKPIAVHCAGGYRSAIGSSILAVTQPEKVFDVGESITELN